MDEYRKEAYGNSLLPIRMMTDIFSISCREENFSTRSYYVSNSNLNLFQINEYFLFIFSEIAIVESYHTVGVSCIHSFPSPVL